MKKCKIIGLCIIIGFAVFGVLGSLVLFFVNIPNDITNIISLWFGIVGTMASVILSIVAMVYSNKSSKDAEESLRKVTEHYETLCQKLLSEEIMKSIGKRGVERIIEQNKSNH